MELQQDLILITSLHSALIN